VILVVFEQFYQLEVGSGGVGLETTTFGLWGISPEASLANQSKLQTKKMKNIT
jgi:hypothetical protein